MSAVPLTPAKPLFNKVHISGRILAVSKATGDRKGFFHEIRLPGEDAYDSPATVDVFAADRLGDVGADIQVVCRVRGFVRRFDYVERETGERRKGRENQIRLYAD